MVEVVGMDEVPGGEPATDETLLCPECDKPCKNARGLSRHMTMAHGAEPASGRRSGGGSRKATNIAAGWADFQTSAALLVSMACPRCGMALQEDAQSDADAIAKYAEKHLKFRKQLEAFLGSVDLMVLVGALMGTAMKMASHHSIAKQVPFMQYTGDDQPHEHDPMQGMAKFMQGLPPETRHAIIDRAFATVGDMPLAQDQARTPATAGSDVPPAPPTEPVPSGFGVGNGQGIGS